MNLRLRSFVVLILLATLFNDESHGQLSGQTLYQHTVNGQNPQYDYWSYYAPMFAATDLPGDTYHVLNDAGEVMFGPLAYPTTLAGNAIGPPSAPAYFFSIGSPSQRYRADAL